MEQYQNYLSNELGIYMFSMVLVLFISFGIIIHYLDRRVRKLEKHKFETEGDMTNIKMFLFARWISTCYADELLDNKMRHTTNEDFDKSTTLSVLNRESGKWWKKQLEYFNTVVYPNYIENGSVQNCKEFLEKT